MQVMVTPIVVEAEKGLKLTNIWFGVAEKQTDIIASLFQYKSDAELYIEKCTPSSCFKIVQVRVI